jgi:hypothetical protein
VRQPPEQQDAPGSGFASTQPLLYEQRPTLHSAHPHLARCQVIVYLQSFETFVILRTVSGLHDKTCFLMSAQNVQRGCGWADMRVLLHNFHHLGISTPLPSGSHSSSFTVRGQHCDAMESLQCVACFAKMLFAPSLLTGTYFSNSWLGNAARLRELATIG